MSAIVTLEAEDKADNIWNRGDSNEHPHHSLYGERT